MTKNIDNSSGEAGTFAKIKDAYPILNDLWPILYPFKKIKRKIQNNDIDQPTIDDVSFLLRRKIEKFAKIKFPNDPKAIEKAILEAKDLWLTNARNDDFMNNTIKRKVIKKIRPNDFTFGASIIELKTPSDILFSSILYNGIKSNPHELNISLDKIAVKMRKDTYISHKKIWKQLRKYKIEDTCFSVDHTISEEEN